ncbi:endonuclease domain-containing protein [Streptomyces sp. NPDC020794]
MCHICGEWKAWAKFPNDKRRANGKGSNCYDCNNWRLTKLYFGIGKEEWRQLHDAQGGVCALCGEEEKRDARLSIDHDHSCCGPNRACRGCIRGLLCDLCNRMLGHAEQRAAVRARFLDYLVRRPFSSVSAGLAEPVLEDVAE